MIFADKIVISIGIILIMSLLIGIIIYSVIDTQRHFAKIRSNEPYKLPNVQQEHTKFVTNSKQQIFEDFLSEMRRFRSNRFSRELRFIQYKQIQDELCRIETQSVRFAYQVTPWSLSYHWNEICFTNIYDKQSVDKLTKYEHPDTQVRFAIITPVFNQQDIIISTIKAIFQNTDGNFEFILICDGCTDQTETKAIEFLSSSKPFNCKSIMVVHINESVYETCADNIGFKLCSAPNIIEIQADITVVQKGYNLILEKPLIEFKDIFAVSGRCTHNKNDSIGLVNSFDATKISDLTDNVCYLMSTVNRGPLLIDHDKLIQLNYLDEMTYALGNDDHDLCFRAWKHFGYRACYMKIDIVSDLRNGSTRKKRSEKQKAILQTRQPSGSPDIQYASFLLPYFRTLNTNNNPLQKITFKNTHLLMFANTNSIHYLNAELSLMILKNLKTSFKSVKLFNEHDLTDFFNKLPIEIHETRGYFYWTFKPYIIHKTMLEAQENEIMIYADSGLFFKDIAYLNTIIHNTERNGYTFFQIDHNVKSYCKCEVIPYFEFDVDKALTDNMVDASVVFVKNTVFMRNIIKQWLDLCLKPELITDLSTGTCKNSSNFKDHRHDQTLLSVIIHNNNLKITGPKTGLVKHHRTRNIKSFKKLWNDIGLDEKIINGITLPI